MTSDFVKLSKNVLGLHLFKIVRDIERLHGIRIILNNKRTMFKNLEKEMITKHEIITKYAQETNGINSEKSLVGTLIDQQELTKLYVHELRSLQYDLDQNITESICDLEYVKFKILKQELINFL